MIPPCPTCHRPPKVKDHGFNCFIIACDDCFDGAPDAGPQPCVAQVGRQSAEDAWTDLVSDWGEETP